MISLACLMFGVAAVSATLQEAHPAPTFFCFLVTGKNPPKASQEEIQTYQRAHIDNFKRLFEVRKLSAAGPLSDPTKLKRGIVVLTVKSRSEIAPLFEADPYVAKGFMELQSLPIKVVFSKVNTQKIDPNGIEENRIVVFTAKGPQTDEASANAGKVNHLDHIQKDGAEAGLAFYASVSGLHDIRAVALFKGKNDEKIESWINEHPLVKGGVLTATKMPQWLARGVL